MHVILGFLGAVVTILWLLHRLAEMGIDLGGLNPWLWQRRRKWRSQHDADPIYAIEEPMESVALLMTATAKADGDMSSSQKQQLLETFKTEFSLSKRDAAGLLISSSHLLGNGDAVRGNIEGVLKPSLPRFNAEQISSALALIERTADVDGPPSVMQADIIKASRSQLAKQTLPKGKWDGAA